MGWRPPQAQAIVDVLEKLADILWGLFGSCNSRMKGCLALDPNSLSIAYLPSLIAREPEPETFGLDHVLLLLATHYQRKIGGGVGG